MAVALSVDDEHLAEARRARREMEYVLHVVAHELRAPLAVASGYVRMLRDGTIHSATALAAPPLDIVEEKLAECRRLVNELLLTAQREQAPVPVRTVVDLGSLARKAIDRAWPRALLIRGTLSLEKAPAAVSAAADPADINRILNNLVGNALEHGGPRPHVTVSVGHDTAPFVSVSDRGPGIRRRDRERVFERFVHGEMSSGAGLGLHLSRNLAAACGGSLELDAGHAGPGARFVLRLPEAPARALAAARNGNH